MTDNPDRPAASGGLVSVASAGVAGITGYPIGIEVHAALGLPGFTIIGAPSAMCRETRDRVRAAIITSGFQWPATRITVDITPPVATRPMASLDLALAVGILAADGQIDRDNITDHTFIGELGLDGTLRGFPAGISLVEAATTRRVVVAPAMTNEARLAGQTIVLAAPDLRAVADALNGRESWPQLPAPPDAPPAEKPANPAISGSPALRAAVAIAAAGGHNLLLVGPHTVEPETTAHQLAGLLPDLTDAEALDVSRVHSATGRQLPPEGLFRRPPLRYPQPDVSAVAMLGGASPTIRPGEISLAHNGTLVLDDLTVHPRAVLDTLAQALDTATIRIARAATQTSLPARFQLIAGMRACPCGAAPDRCLCTTAALGRHAARLSTPLLDRFDLRVTPNHTGSLPVCHSADTKTLARRIEAVRSVAYRREVRTNAQLQAIHLVQVAPLDHHAQRLIDRAVWTGRLTGRGVLAVWRVALTIADLRGDQPPLTHFHLSAALALRPQVLALPGR